MLPILQTRMPYVNMLAEAKVRGLFSSHYPSTNVTSVTWPPKEPTDDDAADDDGGRGSPPPSCMVVVTNTFPSPPPPDSDPSTAKRVFHLVQVDQTGFHVQMHPVDV
ncbi:hypothetical protein DYB28_015329 [Aphanomyces astaci]|uniref:Uncharacterized protein n=1 Tax=Aphanomyces astaci TaxID=112090 RepID=A0A3L6V402_APHAT|nr:hypothetical protein DYB26_012227 [Aphanomyces astaci]RLO03605.1 hypothetical protein DYB28_015329 [Aphanomyces astaci]